MTFRFETRDDKANRIAYLHKWLDSKTSVDMDLSDTLQGLHEIRRMFLVELAYRLEFPVNRHLASLPQANGKEKSWLSSALNALLASFDLGVRDPKSGAIGILSVSPAREDVAGKYYINVPSSETQSGRTQHTTFTEIRSLTFGPRQGHDARRPWTDLLQSKPRHQGRV